MGSEYYRILQLLGEKDLEDVQEDAPIESETKNPIQQLKSNVSMIKSYKTRSKITNALLDIYHLRSNNAVINYVNNQDSAIHQTTVNNNSQDKRSKITSFSSY